MKRFFGRKRNFVFAFVMGLAVASGSSVMAVANESNIVEIDIIAINDFHGALVSSGENDLNPGAPRVVQATLDLKEQNQNTIVLAAGDMYMGTALSNVFRGEPVSHMLRLMNITASLVGNHEFTWGASQIPVWAELEGAPFLTANIQELATGQPVSWAQPYLMVEVDGVNVGIIGLTTVDTVNTTARVNIEHLYFRDVVETAEEYVNLLRGQGADIIVLLSHTGAFQDRETGVITLEEGTERLPYVDGVDLLITSHTHTFVDGQINGVPIIQAMHNGRALGLVNFVFDRDAGELLETNVYIDRLLDRRHDISENAEMLAILEQFDIGPIMQQELGTTPLGLPHPSRRELTTLGQWMSTTMVEYANVDIAFNNAGGLRTSIPAGPITRGMLHEVMPFDNSIVVFEMTGRQIKDVFEFGVHADSHAGVVQFAGAIVEYLPYAEEGSRVHSMMFSNGDPIHLDGVYRVATNSFMATGGDGFSMFLDAQLISDEGIVRDMMESAIMEAGVINFVAEDILIPVTHEIIEPLTPAIEVQYIHEAPYAVEYIPYLPEYVPYIPAPVEYTPAPEVFVAEYVTPAVNSVTVQSGDNLFRIALNHGTTVQALAAHNNISNPALIFVGQVIEIV